MELGEKMAQVTQPPQTQPAPNVNSAPPKGFAPMEWVVIICIVQVIFNIILPYLPFAQSFPIQMVGNVLVTVSYIVGIYAQITGKQPSLLLYLWRMRQNVLPMVVPPPYKKVDLFISYIRTDANVVLVEWIESFLFQEGYTVQYGAWKKNDNFKGHLRQGKSKAKQKRLMLINTPDYQDTINEKRCWQHFFKKLQKDREHCLVINTFPDPLALNVGTIIDFHTLGEANAENEAGKILKDAVQMLLEWRKPLQPVPNPPRFPGATWNVPPEL